MHTTQLGPYELGRILGKGGMGAVYEALDTLHNRRVAVKALNSMLAQAEGFRERFEAEIDSLKTLRHDGIVRLYGYGEQDEVLYYAMELVEGTSLEEEIKAGRRFTWRETAEISIQICRALKHAHDHGVIHRDIKPANVLIDADNHVKLADFGIARLFGSTKLTTAGGVLGTADYMSPEQADGRPVTDRCDQYSLGGVMYALLTGRPPFRAKNLPEMLQLQRFARPDPVRRYARDTPAQLEDVITQLLSKDPDDRFPNTIVLARHLEAMVRAFSRTSGGGVSGVQPSDPAASPGQQDSISLATTRDEPSGETGARTPENLSASPSAKTAGRPHTLEDAPTMAADSGRLSAPSIDLHVVGSLDTDSDSLAEPSRAVGRFTSVDDEALLHGKSDASPLALAAQALAAIASLVAIVLFVRYMLRPPTADALHAQILAAVGDGSEEGADLRSAEGDIDQFLARFPGDSRAERIREFKDAIDIERFQARLQRKAWRIDDGTPLLTVERLYLQAMNVAQTDAERAAGLLQSLIDLYGQEGSAESPREDSPLLPTEACLALAQRTLNELRQQLQEQAEQEMPGLRARLDEAHQLASTDPEQAAGIYEAIIHLYGESAWAGSVVEEARQRLAHLQQRTANSP